MTDKVNGGAGVGDFLTGQLDYYTIATIVPVLQTNVDTPIQDLPGYQTLATTGQWSNVTVVNGLGTAVTYTTQASYLDALAQQTNLTNLIQTFSERANPVAINVSNIAAGTGNVTSADSTILSALGQFVNISAFTTNFGSATTATNINIIGVITERTGLWDVNVNGVPDSNATGYQLLGLNGLQGTVAFDVTNNVLQGDTITTVTDGFYAYTQNVNVFDSTSATEYNTIAVVKTNNFTAGKQ
jgi:hypothetical protein